MINGYYKPNEERAQEAITREQDTPQDKERLKTTPALQGNQDKELQRRATTSHKVEAIPIGGYAITMKKAAGSPGTSSDTILYRQTCA